MNWLERQTAVEQSRQREYEQRIDDYRDSLKEVITNDNCNYAVSLPNSLSGYRAASEGIDSQPHRDGCQCITCLMDNR